MDPRIEVFNDLNPYFTYLAPDRLFYPVHLVNPVLFI